MRGGRSGQRAGGGERREGGAPRGALAGKAFCPGHITGFFEICDRSKDPLHRGSRGAGVNLELGVLTTVTADCAPRPEIIVRLNGMEERAPTTRRALRLLLGRRRLRVVAECTSELPVARGLGMSGAGALSASLALAGALRLPHALQRAGRAAHIAEVLERTGLGDVPAQLCGGWEVRLRAGYPPYGLVDRLLGPSGELAICVTGEEVPTRGVLGDHSKRRLVNRIGRRCIEELLSKPSLERFFALSLEFAKRTDLVSNAAVELAERIGSSGAGLASVSMIGNTVFAMGEHARLQGLMEGRGDLYLCGAGAPGARTVA